MKTTFPIKVESNVHPSHYLIHKYWSRKPHNVVANYIKYFTNKGETVLDPFMGSGVTILESIKNERHPIGVDINPISVFLVKNMLSKIDLKNLKNAFEELSQSLKETEKELYVTKCKSCNKLSKLDTCLFFEQIKCDFCGNTNTIKECERKGTSYYCRNCDKKLRRINGNISYQLRKVKVDCENCGKLIQESSLKDEKLMNKIHHIFLKKKNEKNFWAPEDKIPPSIKRSGKEKLYELFSERNLIGINALRNGIKELSYQKEIKELLLLNLTASISSASRMIPANEKTLSGKSGWQIPKYYIFPTHIEKNIFQVFKQRFRSNLKGIEELQSILKRENHSLHNSSSKDLSFLKDNSVDYIFTDPPYGGTIHYLSLSEIWNSLIGEKSNFKQEIIIDKNREKSLEGYERDLEEVFKECSRVLKEDRMMTVTFNAKDLKVFNSLISSCLNSGFSLESINHQDFAVSSATQGLNWKNTLKGDFILNFKNLKKPFMTIKKYSTKKNPVELLINIIEENKEIEFGNLFALLIPKMISIGQFNSDILKSLNLEKTLTQNFKKIEKDNKIFWAIKN